MERYGHKHKRQSESHLRFADDIVLMAESLEELKRMLDDLATASQQIGLKINLDKTKIMINDASYIQNLSLSKVTSTKFSRNISTLGKFCNKTGTISSF